MADTLTPPERSERMSRIKSRDTKPELALRKALHALGLRYRLGSRLPGKPDLVFPRHKAVVFVHGCFWHRHAGCKVATTPKSNTGFWVDKFERNVTRDERVARELKAAGCRVIITWECELTGKGNATKAALQVAAELGVSVAGDDHGDDRRARKWAMPRPPLHAPRDPCDPSGRAAG